MHIVSDVVKVLEGFAPLQYQESYDNCGLQIGRLSDPVTATLLTLDVTEQVVDEALVLGANFILSHHPLIFGGVKSLTGKTDAERAIIKAIQNNISIYASHTCIDNHFRGVSYKMAEKLGLTNIQPLQAQAGQLFKLVTFIPTDYLETVRTAIFEAGAGHIGDYDCCSYSVSGEGTFRASENANPFVGEKGTLHTEPEKRFETIFPKHLEKKVIQALLKAHPYEEVAFDIYPVTNKNPLSGAGAIGEVQSLMEEETFLEKIKEVFAAPCVRHTRLLGKPIKKVAMCGGSGSFMLSGAMAQNADIFISADFKYHQFMDAENKIIIADIGHYESEQYILEVFYELLSKNFSKFANYFTKVNTNPINYF